MRVINYLQSQVDVPRTFVDALNAAVEVFTSSEEGQARNERVRIGLLEVMVTSNDENGTVLVIEDGNLATVVSTKPGFGDESSSGTLETDGLGRGVIMEVKV